VRLHPDTKEPEAVQLCWGLVPSRADDLKIGYRAINARLDTAPTKPAFRSSFKHRHCLVPADGFFEWQKTGSKTKQPYHIRLRDGSPFAFARLWETWNREGEPVQTCTILTTEPNELTRQVHDRMQVIVGRDHYGDWLDAARSGTLHHLRLAVLKYFHPKPKMEVTCNNDGIAIVADPLADQARASSSRVNGLKS
jgi:putative SOS response-associated peptidase YedK